MEREGVKGPCVVGHVEVQKLLGPRCCSADCQTVLGSHYELPRAPLERKHFQITSHLLYDFVDLL